MKITVLLGAPGSGKGTQAKRLAQTDQFRHLSTGDMLRAAIQAKSPVGLKAKTLMDKGELVPDNVILEVIESALKELPKSSKALLDGCIRTVPQAQGLDKSEVGPADLAVYFRIPEDILVERLTGRRTCEKCGEPYHVSFMPPKREGICDKCGGKLIQRSDDNKNVVKKRLEVFNRENENLLSYYRDKKRLKEIDADQSVDSIHDELAHILH